MDTLALNVIAVILSAVLSIEAYKLQCLTRGGAVASFAVGSFVGVLGSINAFFLLTVFTIAGFVATLRDFNRKKAAGLQEGELGERTWRNVLGVGLPPCFVVFLDYVANLGEPLFAVLFISTIAVAGSDTIASEIGIKDPRVVLITTFKPVEPGTNGGVSVKGTAVSTVAAFLIALLGWVVVTAGFDILFLIPFVAGVFGNIMDSVLGAVLENKGYISKYANNCTTAFMGAALGAAVYLAVA